MMETNLFTETRPIDGQTIMAKFPSGNWIEVTYYDDGIDGVLEDDEGDVTELEEYGKEMEWMTFSKWNATGHKSP